MKKIFFSILIVISGKIYAQKDTASYVIKDGQLEVTKSVVEIQTYSYNVLIRQRKIIEDQKTYENEQTDKRLAEIDILIAEAKKGGIDKAEAVEAQPAEIKP